MPSRRAASAGSASWCLGGEESRAQTVSRRQPTRVPGRAPRAARARRGRAEWRHGPAFRPVRRSRRPGSSRSSPRSSGAAAYAVIQRRSAAGLRTLVAELGEVALRDPVDVAVQLGTERPAAEAAEPGETGGDDLLGVVGEPHRWSRPVRARCQPASSRSRLTVGRATPRSASVIGRMRTRDDPARAGVGGRLRGKRGRAREQICARGVAGHRPRVARGPRPSGSAATRRSRPVARPRAAVEVGLGHAERSVSSSSGRSVGAPRGGRRLADRLRTFDRDRRQAVEQRSSSSSTMRRWYRASG